MPEPCGYAVLLSYRKPCNCGRIKNRMLHFMCHPAAFLTAACTCWYPRSSPGDIKDEEARMEEGRLADGLNPSI